MATYTVDGLENLGPELAKLLDRVVPALARSLRAEIGDSLMAQLVDKSPVGNPAVDPHPGKYRASHVPNAGEIKTKVLPNMPAYPIPGTPEIESALQGADPGASLYIANAAADERYPNSGYAGLLEGGRRQYSRRSTGKTVWVGSEQAPEGIYGPSVNALKGMRGTIEANAVRRARELIRGR